jgi:hypothetical protein
MADMYLETLRPNVAEQWKKANKTPEHIVKEKIAKSEVEAGILKAKEEREKFLKENPQKEFSIEEEVRKLKSSIEEKKKKGKNTVAVENKLTDFENRTKPLKGKKINPKDAEALLPEIKSLGEEIEKL